MTTAVNELMSSFRSDNDGADQLVVAVFTYRTKERLSKQRIKRDVIRKARHVLKGAATAT